MDSDYNYPFDKYDPCYDCLTQDCSECIRQAEENEERKYEIFKEVENLYNQ